MKKILFLLVCILFTINLFAQAPQKMSYQAVIRNADNSLVSVKPIGIRISVLQGFSTGVAVYVENQNGTTNANGLVTMQIGAGTIIEGSFEQIDWSKGPYFIKIETDPNGGSDYTIVGNSELLSVPYALFALNADVNDYLGISYDFINLSYLVVNNIISINMTKGLSFATIGNLIVSKSIANHFHGRMISYNKATGILQLQINEIIGNSTFSYWEIKVDGAKGDTGATGAIGQDGINGSNGTNGANGDTGATGAIGQDGIKGTNGINGAKGDTGATGAIGQDGIKGTNGTNGATGFTGATGAIGQDGIKGTDGTNGANGDTGATGATGQDGIKGTNGAKGDTGATGAIGQDGTKGTNGTNGANGFTGATGAIGQDGINGTNGTNGAKGDTGATGATGQDGINGTNGAKGDTGATGATGQDGIKGTNGANGDIGATGATGQDGIKGTNGANGDIGATGATGQDGIKGTNGAKGDTGATGQDGINGTKGDTGATGAIGQDGIKGTNGTNGANGFTGATGAIGQDGIKGTNGANGDTGATGATGQNGINGTNGTNGAKGDTGATGAVADTTSMLLPYLRRSDTSAMLNTYLKSIVALNSNALNLGIRKLNTTDTISLLQKADTAAMLNKYLRGIVLPINGGTGIVNSNVSTLTLSGEYATTLTTKGVTRVTLPISGTLATEAYVLANNSSNYYSVSAGDEISTNSIVDKIAEGMVLTPEAGKYLVTFNSQYIIAPSDRTGQTKIDLRSAYNSLMAKTNTVTSHVPTYGGGETLTAGVYGNAGACTLVGTLILDGQGNSNAEFVFKYGAAFSTAANTTTILINGASACNVYWIAEGAIALGVSTFIQGTIISNNGAVTTGNSCTIVGRLYSNNGAVGLDGSNVSLPTVCSSATNYGMINSFVAFTSAGDVTNLGASILTGDIGTDFGAVMGFGLATVNGTIYKPSLVPSSTTASFGIFQNGALIPFSTRTRISTLNLGEISLSAIATVSANEAIDIRYRIDAGIIKIQNRIFTIMKVQ